MKIKPLFDKIVIEAVESMDKTQSGIVLPGTAQEKPQMAKVIADEFGSVCEVCGVTSKNFPRPAKRPKNTSLRSLRLQEAKLPPMPNWEASLREFVRKNQKAPE